MIAGSLNTKCTCVDATVKDAYRKEWRFIYCYVFRGDVGAIQQIVRDSLDVIKRPWSAQDAGGMGLVMKMASTASGPRRKQIGCPNNNGRCQTTTSQAAARRHAGTQARRHAGRAKQQRVKLQHDTGGTCQTAKSQSAARIISRHTRAREPKVKV